jgi:hypothetical protein
MVNMVQKPHNCYTSWTVYMNKTFIQKVTDRGIQIQLIINCLLIFPKKKKQTNSYT